MVISRFGVKTVIVVGFQSTAQREELELCATEMFDGKES
jgi:hypothetical protein